MLQTIRKNLHLLTFLLPGLLLYGVFMAYPLISSMAYSLFEWDGLVRKGFIALANFQTLLSQWPYHERFWGAVGHNTLFFLLTLALQTLIGLPLAALLSRKWPGFSWFQTAYFLPYTLSMVVVGFLWLLLLNPTFGAVAQGLKVLGLSSWVQPWLGQTSTALITVILVNAWHWLGFPILVFLAGVQGIPREYYEAALVDGASELQSFFRITLPLLVPTLGMMTILTFIWDFNAFELVFVMQGASGSPAYSSDLLATFFYRTAFGDPTTGGEPGQIGLASSIAVMMLIFIGTASYFGVRVVQRKYVEF